VQEHEKALNSIAVYIRMNPETMEGMQLRKFLWSLYDSQELINLMRFYGRLPPGDTQIWYRPSMMPLSAAFFSRTDLHRALVVSGDSAGGVCQGQRRILNHFADVEATMVMLARNVASLQGIPVYRTIA